MGAGEWMDAPLEVAVAREDGSSYEVLFLDGSGDLGSDGAGVADAGGAPVPDDVEAKGVQGVLHPGLGEVLGDYLGPGGKAGLDIRLACQTLGHGLPCEQAGTKHHRGVAGVGATGDGGDDDGAVADLE